MQAATRDRLRVGMVVQVRGRINGDGTGVADSIQYNDCVQGPITAMNQVQNTVTVLGQTVKVDDDTVFDGVTLRDMNSFAIGDQVEVSCLPDPARQPDAGHPHGTPGRVPERRQRSLKSRAR